jgi:hypothetical protein
MSKFTITCREFKPFKRNTLVGFVQIRIAEMHLDVKDVAVYQKNASRRAALSRDPRCVFARGYRRSPARISGCV